MTIKLPASEAKAKVPPLLLLLGPVVVKLWPAFGAAMRLPGRTLKRWGPSLEETDFAKLAALPQTTRFELSFGSPHSTGGRPKMGEVLQDKEN